MDKFFDAAYERDQAGKRHHYSAVCWDHQFQGKRISYAVWGLAITRACTVLEASCISLQPMLYIERCCRLMPQEPFVLTARRQELIKYHARQRAAL
jgi:hypothetical protein